MATPVFFLVRFPSSLPVLLGVFYSKRTQHPCLFCALPISLPQAVFTFSDLVFPPFPPPTVHFCLLPLPPDGSLLEARMSMGSHLFASTTRIQICGCSLSWVSGEVIYLQVSLGFPCLPHAPTNWGRNPVPHLPSILPSLPTHLHPP